MHDIANDYFRCISSKNEWNAGPSNYEHIYYLIKQVSDEWLGETDNPAINYFIKALLSDSCAPNNGKELVRVCRRARNYIVGIVCNSLSQEPDSTEHLEPFARACQKGLVSSVSTLCHDIHVETYFRGEGVPVADGFSAEKEDGHRYWRNDFLPEKGLPFLKLHGSVNWHFLNSRNIRELRSEREWQPSLQRIPSEGNFNFSTENREVLIGTFNKMTEYGQRVYLDLFYRFRRVLDEAERLVVCGYGFGDKGVNENILEWFEAAPKRRRILLIHPNPDELITQKARTAIRNIWFGFSGRSLKQATDTICARLEDVSVPDLLKRIQ